MLVESEMASKYHILLTCSNFCHLIRPKSISLLLLSLLLPWLGAYDQGKTFMYELGTAGIKTLDASTVLQVDSFPCQGKRS